MYYVKSMSAGKPWRGVLACYGSGVQFHLCLVQHANLAA